jgi:hypothetical protein
MRLSWFFRTTSTGSQAWGETENNFRAGWRFVLANGRRWKCRRRPKAAWHLTGSGRDQNIFRVDAEL